MTRRFDPDRRERILDAALAVIAEHGVAGTTHRRIAVVADVPLGSLTYHFVSLDELVAAAFTRFAERGHTAWAAHFDAVEDVSQLVDALTDLVMSIVADDALDWTLSYELYLAAVRRPELREVPERWMQASRTVLQRWVDADTAQDLDALVEGLSMHTYLTTTSPARAEVRRAFARMVPLP